MVFTKIVSAFGKAVSAQEYVLVDDQGRTRADSINTRLLK
jgi:hypothetical protein